jgi:hypothetical protein
MKVKPVSSIKMSERNHSKELAFYKRAVQEGVPYKKPGQYAKFSASVHADTYEAFRKCANELGYKMQDAITESLDLWLERKTKKNGTP